MKLFIKTGSKAGFTLIELILVIGIIAALVGIAAPYYGDYVNESKYAVMRSNLNTFRKALMDYRADKGSYPASADTVGTELVPKYLLDFPVDPTDNALATWGYQIDGDGYKLADYYMQLK